MSKIQKIYYSLVARIEKLRGLPPFIARVAVGTVFVESGWGKIHNISKVVDYFTSLGIPAPEFQAHLVAGTELACGLLLLAGLLTRISALPLIITMIVALLTAKRKELGAVTDLFSISEFLYIVLLFWIFVSGAGPMSLDRLICKKNEKRE